MSLETKQSILELISNGSFTHHFNIDVCQESYSATIDLGACPSPDSVKNILEAKDFEVINEADSVFTIKKKS